MERNKRNNKFERRAEKFLKDILPLSYAIFYNNDFHERSNVRKVSCPVRILILLLVFHKIVHVIVFFQF